MNALTLQWHDAGQKKTQQIYEQQPSKNPGTVRIGRNPQLCDIVVSNPTVSGLHVEIFFNPQQSGFYLRNLREQNPPLIDQQTLIHGDAPLREGSTIYLGQMELKVTAVVINTIPPTILAPPQPHTPPAQPQPPIQHQHYPPTPPAQPQPPIQHQHYPPTPPAQPHHHHQYAPQPSPQGVYGLECPKCHKVSPPENLQVGCPWCGTSLAAAVSVLVSRGN